MADQDGELHHQDCGEVAHEHADVEQMLDKMAFVAGDFGLAYISKQQALTIKDALARDKRAAESGSQENYDGPDPSVECAYPPCTNRLRRSDLPGPQWCSKEHRSADLSDQRSLVKSMSDMTLMSITERWHFAEPQEATSGLGKRVAIHFITRNIDIEGRESLSFLGDGLVYRQAEGYLGSYRFLAREDEQRLSGLLPPSEHVWQPQISKAEADGG